MCLDVDHDGHNDYMCAYEAKLHQAGVFKGKMGCVGCCEWDYGPFTGDWFYYHGWLSLMWNWHGYTGWVKVWTGTFFYPGPGC